MSYENAPATKMLATHCVVCRKALVDAISVESGIGPECRKKHGYTKGNPANREAANAVIHEIATSDYNPGQLLVSTDKLRELGFDTLADVVCKRNATIEITQAEVGMILVNSPFNEGMVQEFRNLRGVARYSDPINRKGFKGFIVAGNQWPALNNALRKYFPNTLGIGRKGPFVISPLAVQANS